MGGSFFKVLKRRRELIKTFSQYYKYPKGLMGSRIFIICLFRGIFIKKQGYCMNLDILVENQISLQYRYIDVVTV